MSTNQSKTNRQNLIILILTAIFIALTYVFTAFVNIRLPIMGNGGLIHLGNVPLFIAAIIFGKKSGAVVGAVGMGLFDLLSGWVTWAPFTFVIVGLMGFVVGLIAEKKRTLLSYSFAFGAALLIKIVGYYIAEVILYKNFIAPFGSIPGNIIQVVTAAIIVIIAIKPIELAAKKAGFKNV